MKGDDPEIATAQTPKRFDGRLALLEKIRKTFTDNIPNNTILMKIIKMSHTLTLSGLGAEPWYIFMYTFFDTWKRPLRCLVVMVTK